MGWDWIGSNEEVVEGKGNGTDGQVGFGKLQSWGFRMFVCLFAPFIYIRLFDAGSSNRCLYVFYILVVYIVGKQISRQIGRYIPYSSRNLLQRLCLQLLRLYTSSRRLHSTYALGRRSRWTASQLDDKSSFALLGWNLAVLADAVCRIYHNLISAAAKKEGHVNKVSCL